MIILILPWSHDGEDNLIIMTTKALNDFIEMYISQNSSQITRRHLPLPPRVFQ